MIPLLIAEARKDAGLTQLDVAERLGTCASPAGRLGQTQPFVSRCERGGRRPDLVEAHAVCAAMGVPFADLVTASGAEVAVSG